MKHFILVGLAILLFVTGCQSNSNEATESKRIQNMRIMYIPSMISM